MANERGRENSMVERAVWPLLLLTAALHVYIGVSSLAYVFIGVSNPASGLGQWTIAGAGGLQAVAAVGAFVLAARRELRGATLAVAGCIVLGWISTLPSVLVQGLDFRGSESIASFYFVMAPLIAIVAVMLAWRNRHLIVAAHVATATTSVGILVVIVFTMVIAIYGF